MDNYCLVGSMENMAHLSLNDLDMEVVFPHLWRAIQKKRLAHFTIQKTFFPIFPASIYLSPKYSLVKSRLFAFKSQYLFVFQRPGRKAGRAIIYQLCNYQLSCHVFQFKA